MESCAELLCLQKCETTKNPTSSFYTRPVDPTLCRGVWIPLSSDPIYRFPPWEGKTAIESKPCLSSLRPLGLGLRGRPEVGLVDRAPVPATAGQPHVPGTLRPGPVLHDGGGLQTALPAVWRRALRSSRHLEIWWEQQEHDAVGGETADCEANAAWQRADVTPGAECSARGIKLWLLLFFYLLSCRDEGALPARRQPIRWAAVNDRILDAYKLIR